MTAEYLPGQCNIGPKEIAYRRNFGWASLGVLIVLLVVLLWTGVNPLWRFLTFFPAAGAAIGFLQAYLHFCVAFAHQGVYNFGPLGQVTGIDDKAAQRKDRRRGVRMALWAAVIGAAIALISVFLV